MKTKNQNLFHATFNNKKTLCGLSNQYKSAETIIMFKELLKNNYLMDVCCIKCKKIICKIK
jgi:hypothetical protein